MFRSCFVILFICYCIPCNAQQRELDSLLLELQKHPAQDTTRVRMMNDIAFYYSSIAPAKGLNYAREAAELSLLLKDDHHLAPSYSYQAMNYGGMGEDSLALEYYKKALFIHQRLNNTLRIATSYNNIAITLVNLSSYNEALLYHTKAYEVFEQLKDSSRMANSLNNHAVVYLYLNDYRQSLEFNLKALRILEHLDNKTAMANTRVNIGLVYNHLSDFDKSLFNHRAGYDLYKEIGNKKGMINVLGNIGNVYHDLDSNDKALEYYKQALEMSQEIGDKRGIASNTSNIGIVYSGMAEYSKALQYFDRSLEINTASGDKKRIAGDLIEIAKIHLKASGLPNQPTTIQYNLIESYGKRSLQLGKDIGSLDAQREAWLVLYQLQERQHKPQLALEAYRKYIELRDSILNSAIKNDIQRKEIEFEFEKKEMRLLANQQQQQAESLATIQRHRIIRNTFIVITIVIVLSAIISFLFYKRKRDANEKQRAAEFKLKEKENEMDVLLLQMNPHFIFNSLNSINYYMDNNETATATDFTTRFAKLMRMTLENSRKKEISLETDISMIELYMKLESSRLKQGFTYSIYIDEQINADRTFVPPMILQPFVENSIWHGLASKPSDGHIVIEVLKSDEMIKYVIEDNGIGMNSEKTSQQEKISMGMEITENRIKLLNETKNTHASIKMIDLTEGVRVEVTLPYEAE